MAGATQSSRKNHALRSAAVLKPEEIIIIKSIALLPHVRRRSLLRHVAS